MEIKLYNRPPTYKGYIKDIYIYITEMNKILEMNLCYIVIDLIVKTDVKAIKI